MTINGSVLQGLVTTEEVPPAVNFWRLARCLGQKEVKYSLVHQPLSLRHCVASNYVGCARGKRCTTLKDHLTFLVSAGFTG